MKLFAGNEQENYSVHGMTLPQKLAKRLEALGLIKNTKLLIIRKKTSALIISIRGTRFALGKAVANNIDVEMV
jgi:ferrous iron transport protein A